MKKKHFIFIIQNNNKNRKHIKIKKIEHFFKKLKHEPNIVEITHLCIRHGVHTSITYSKGRRDEMILSIHPFRRPSI